VTWAAIKAIKAAVTDQTGEMQRVGKQVGKHEDRLRTVEQAA